MSKVDRDLDAILEFCQDFKVGFIEPTRSEADGMIGISNDINSSLNGTKFATKSQENVMEMAKKIKSAVDVGEARILELERKVRQQIERGKEFTR